MLSGLGLSEILLILLVTLVVIGPEKIPEVARMLGKGMREVRRASNMFRDMFMLEEGVDSASNKRSTFDEERRRVGRPVDQPQKALQGSVAREERRRRRSRPIMIQPVRSATNITRVELPAAGEPAGCGFEKLAAPRPGAPS